MCVCETGSQACWYFLLIFFFCRLFLLQLDSRQETDALSPSLPSFSIYSSSSPFFTSYSFPFLSLHLLSSLFLCSIIIYVFYVLLSSFSFSVILSTFFLFIFSSLLWLYLNFFSNSNFICHVHSTILSEILERLLLLLIFLLSFASRSSSLQKHIKKQTTSNVKKNIYIIFNTESINAISVFSLFILLCKRASCTKSDSVIISCRIICTTKI